MLVSVHMCVHIYVHVRFSLLLPLPASCNQYSSRPNANKYPRIHHHLHVLVSRGLYKALLYFTLLHAFLYIYLVISTPQPVY